MMGGALRRHRQRDWLGDEEAALLALLSRHSGARDVALLAMSRDDAAWHVALWQRVVTRTLPVHQGYPLALLGMAAWLTGEGALAAICLERAEVLVAPTRLVAILSHVIDEVVPPRLWDELRPELLAAAESPVRRAVALPATPPGR